MMWFLVSFLIIGLIFLVFGSLLLFKNGFVEKIREQMWKSKNDAMSKRDEYIYNKYVRGLGFLIIGLMVVGFAIFGLIKFFFLD